MQQFSVDNLNLTELSQSVENQNDVDVQKKLSSSGSGRTSVDEGYSIISPNELNTNETTPSSNLLKYLLDSTDHAYFECSDINSDIESVSSYSDDEHENLAQEAGSEKGCEVIIDIASSDRDSDLSNKQDLIHKKRASQSKNALTTPTTSRFPCPSTITSVSCNISKNSSQTILILDPPSGLHPKQSVDEAVNSAIIQLPTSRFLFSPIISNTTSSEFKFNQNRYSSTVQLIENFESFSHEAPRNDESTVVLSDDKIKRIKLVKDPAIIKPLAKRPGIPNP